MQPVSPDELRIDRTLITVGSLDDEDPDIEYWANATAEDRLRYMELLRRINYGRRATEPMKKVLSVVTRR